MLAKEVVLVEGVLAMYLIRGTVHIAPVFMGKLAMVVQTLFIIWLFACYFFAWVPVKTYYVMLALVMLVVLGALVQYVKIGLEQLVEEH